MFFVTAKKYKDICEASYWTAKCMYEYDPESFVFPWCFRSFDGNKVIIRIKCPLSFMIMTWLFF